jgi:hypothetical protein
MAQHDNDRQVGGQESGGWLGRQGVWRGHQHNNQKFVGAPQRQWDNDNQAKKYWRWTLESGARQIGATKAPPQPMWNVLVLWRQTQQFQKSNNRWEASRRLSTNGLRIGKFFRPHTLSWLFGAPNSFWCHCCSDPAFFCDQPFVLSRILMSLN